MKYKTIKGLREGINKGEVKEENLYIQLDNDGVYFGLTVDMITDESELEEIEVDSAEGYSDIEQLYKLVFPKATVEWC